MEPTTADLGNGITFTLEEGAVMRTRFPSGRCAGADVREITDAFLVNLGAPLTETHRQRLSIEHDLLHTLLSRALWNRESVVLRTFAAVGAHPNNYIRKLGSDILWNQAEGVRLIDMAFDKKTPKFNKKRRPVIKAIMFEENHVRRYQLLRVGGVCNLMERSNFDDKVIRLFGAGHMNATLDRLLERLL